MKDLPLSFSACISASPARTRNPFCSGPSRTAAARWPDVDVSVSRGNEAETAVAVNHKKPAPDHNRSDPKASALFLSRSTDGGKTWQHNLIANGDSLGFACCDA